ncbi:MAG TPA: hypothetical protein VFI11_07365 [Anaerolineales bacterium]|nr:hypothetical protein [Anaerolineales bacterium]
MDSSSAPSAIPRQIVVIFLEVLTDLLGEHGTRALLRRAALTDWIELGSESPDAAPVLAQSVSGLLASLEELYGARGGRGLARRLGSGLVDRYLRDLGALRGMRDEAFQRLPWRDRVRLGLGALRRVLSQLNAFAAELTVAGDRVVFSVPECPFCAGRSLDAPGCSPLVGLVEAALSVAVPDMHLPSEETECRAVGARSCSVTVRVPQPAPAE